MVFLLRKQFLRKKIPENYRFFLRTMFWINTYSIKVITFNKPSYISYNKPQNTYTRHYATHLLLLANKMDIITPFATCTSNEPISVPSTTQEVALPLMENYFIANSFSDLVVLFHNGRPIQTHLAWLHSLLHLSLSLEVNIFPAESSISVQLTKVSGCHLNIDTIRVFLFHFLLLFILLIPVFHSQRSLSCVFKSSRRWQSCSIHFPNFNRLISAGIDRRLNRN